MLKYLSTGENLSNLREDNFWIRTLPTASKITPSPTDDGYTGW